MRSPRRHLNLVMRGVCFARSAHLLFYKGVSFFRNWDKAGGRREESETLRASQKMTEVSQLTIKMLNFNTKMSVYGKIELRSPGYTQVKIFKYVNYLLPRPFRVVLTVLRPALPCLSYSVTVSSP